MMLTLIDPAQIAVYGVALSPLVLIGWLLWRIALDVRCRERERSRRSGMLNDIPAELRWRVFERDGFTCQRCGTRSDLLVDFKDEVPVDRVVPLRQLVTRCVRCSVVIRHSDLTERSIDTGN